MGARSIIKTQYPKAIQKKLTELILEGKMTQSDLVIWATDQGLHATNRIINVFCRKVHESINELTHAGVPYDMATKYSAEFEQLSMALLVHECNQQATKHSEQAIMDIKQTIPYFSQQVNQ